MQRVYDLCHVHHACNNAFRSADRRNHDHYSGAYGIWQHSEKGNVDGINGNVDLDICYKDFPTIIKAKGLNGFGKEEVLPNPPAPAAEDGITVEVTVDGNKYSGKLNKA